MTKTFFSALLLLAINVVVYAQAPGTFNANFSENGWDTLIANDNGFFVNKILVQTDEKILICGGANFSNEGHEAVVIRYNTDGTLDAEFGGGDGMVRSDADYFIYTRAYGMALQNDGKIIIGGDQLYNSERIIRLNQDGSLDSTFGENGIADFSRSNAEFIYHVGVQSDNKIIVCGQESRQSNGSFQPHVFLWRLTADGVLDATFGNAGVVSYIAEEWQNVFSSYLIINNLIILQNDEILINQSFSGQTNNFVLIRKLNADGSVDNSYGVNGNAIKSKVASGVYTYSSSALQEDGSVVSSITTRDAINGTYSESLFRVNAQGVEDVSFNFEFNVANISGDNLRTVILGNRIYVFGITSQESSFGKIYCFDLNGNLVSNFGTNGIAELSQNGIPPNSYGQLAISDNGTLYYSCSLFDPNNTSNNQFLTASIIGFPYESSVGFESLNRNEVSNLLVFPNPCSEKIVVRESDAILPQYYITDTQGRTVLKTNSSSIDISGLSNGIYFLRNGKNYATTKFVVNHEF